MQRTRWMRLTASGAFLALGVAACGGGGEPGGGGGTTPAAGPGGGTETATATATATEGAVTDRQNVDGTLKIGTLVPDTGDLAALGPPQQLGYELAVEQVNEAGGVLGNDVQLVRGDSGTNEQVANNAVDQHLRNNVDAILGAASSRISLSVIDKITGSQVVQCSPSNTGLAFTEYEDEDPGFYFRTAPPDKFQGPALAQTILQDGFSEVGVIALQDEYGQGFAEALKEGLEGAGAEVVADVAYDPNGTEFAADVQKLVEANPQAVALISFPDTGSKILREMISKGIGPGDIGVYTADGMQTGEIGQLVSPDEPSVVNGMKGTAPSSQGSQAFTEAFEEFAPPDTPQIFSAHAYDCANITALAAESAGTDDPTEFHNEMVNVTKDGEECSDFPSCKSLLDEGQDIDYEGATGPDFVPAGEPGSGTYEIWEFQVEGGEGVINTLDTITIGEDEDASPSPGGGTSPTGGSPSPTS
jgi:branched-chain amino acid transport system substrate-binding protein